MRKVLLLSLLVCVLTTTGCASWPFDWLGDYYSAGDNTYEGKRQHYESQAAKWSENR